MIIECDDMDLSRTKLSYHSRSKIDHKDFRKVEDTNNGKFIGKIYFKNLIILEVNSEK